MKIKCELTIYPGSLHISQIVTGFLILEQQNVIQLKINIKDPKERRLSINNVEAIINDKIKVVYDVLDGYNFGDKNVDDYLEDVDYYFKRSYNEIENKKFKNYSKIYPLGFNYWVTNDKDIIDKYNGNKNIISSIKEINNRRKFNKEKRICNFKNFEQAPYYNNNPKILFLARVWEPDKNLSDELNEERNVINKNRAECIRRLKKEFGDNFIGGFNITPFTVENFNDCISENISTDKANFMRLIKESDICIATLGLHKSNGWKLGEYIAASKAIISEKMYYEVPGEFKKYKNYLEFNNIDELIENSYILFKNYDLLYEIKVNNFEYYHNYLRPDRLILNTLLKIIR